MLAAVNTVRHRCSHTQLFPMLDTFFSGKTHLSLVDYGTRHCIAFHPESAVRMADAPAEIAVCALRVHHQITALFYG
jgi:hypothetical protein